MDVTDLMDKVDMTDVPEAYQPVVSLIGLDSFLKLCKYAMGDELYFPMQESILRNTRNRLVIGEYNGYNLPELSRRYNLTRKQIMKIVKSPNPP